MVIMVSQPGIVVLIVCSVLGLGSAVPPPDGYFDRATFHEQSLDPEGSSPAVEEDKSWPGFPYLGQVSAVAVDRKGNLHLFHRGNRIWDQQTFTADWQLSDLSHGPIPNDTVLILDGKEGSLLYSWGANRFYVPHGLTVDHLGNSWVTDVGLHQVLKFSAVEVEPELVLGEALVPGSDRDHFCQPTSVAVLPEGRFFVADGYCNSRILLFDRDGHLLKEIGTADGMRVPHSLALVPEQNALCVADRENARVLCYDTASGVLLASFNTLGRVFGIDARGNQLFVVNGPNLWENIQSLSANHGLVLDLQSGFTKTLWGPQQGFQGPHDLAVSPDGNSVYVSEIELSAPKRIYKFSIYN